MSLRRNERRRLVRHRAVFPKVQASIEEWALDFVAMLWRAIVTWGS